MGRMTDVRLILPQPTFQRNHALHLCSIYGKGSAAMATDLQGLLLCTMLDNVRLLP